MIAWALGRIGGARAKAILEHYLPLCEDPVKAELQIALDG